MRLLFASNGVASASGCNCGHPASGHKTTTIAPPLLSLLFRIQLHRLAELTTYGFPDLEASNSILLSADNF